MWLYNANLDFCEEICRVNRLENMADIGSLNGAVYKRKLLSPNRLKGLASFAMAGLTWYNLLPLTLLVGQTVPAIGIAAALFYGIK